ncbi:hypothetical protein M2139_002847 [Enterococcus sp. PF1-24]|uniref:type II toxin-antitoxin system RelE/ParE family toxin n=1 Tax=unclassified Enterococcus TaxID=2608891 RepID=UPI002472FBF7|nr:MULTISPECIES: type II toxin-antitoxin system RelE/ParE family toxin [unclassified Enterococcus]MDH6365815.1 hypothetical protein [Enterococcus sp. PFB1-1]MDH6402917.1 hypothetical protein [Enterococcus sp. PF1-24]
MTQYSVVYSHSFVESLSKHIIFWEKELKLSQESINKFIKIIYTSIELLKIFPKKHPEVSNIYHFSEPTYRITIGKSFAIFYRLNDEKKEIYMGNIFSTKQINLAF